MLQPNQFRKRMSNTIFHIRITGVLTCVCSRLSGKLSWLVFVLRQPGGIEEPLIDVLGR